MHLLWDSGNGRWVRLKWVSHRSFVFGRPCSLETSEFVGLNKGWEKGQYNVSVKLFFEIPGKSNLLGGFEGCGICEGCGVCVLAPSRILKSGPGKQE